MLREMLGKESAPSVDLTPVIDVVFLLLIFFLVATTFQQSEREMEITLPETVSGGPISMALRELVINVDAQGRYIVSGRTLDEDALRGAIQSALAERPDRKVTVRGDRDASYGSIARALDICKRAGISEPYLDTAPSRAGTP